MGGYGEKGNAGCEPFFPLKDCPEHKGIYPVFGKVLEGMEEIFRLEKVETTPVQTAIEGYVVDTPVEKQTIEKVIDLDYEKIAEEMFEKFTNRLDGGREEKS